MGKRFESEYDGRMVWGLLLETAEDLNPYASALDSREVAEVARLLEAGSKVEVLDEPIAEIHVDDDYVLCGFPNPTRDDAPELCLGGSRALTTEEKADMRETARSFGLDPDSAGTGAVLLTPNRWSKLSI